MKTTARSIQRRMAGINCDTVLNSNCYSAALQTFKNAACAGRSPICRTIISAGITIEYILAHTENQRMMSQNHITLLLNSLLHNIQRTIQSYKYLMHNCLRDKKKKTAVIPLNLSTKRCKLLHRPGYVNGS